ncbi:MAG: hypothetical protein AMJ56_06895 [Anaerolineae bacterium SG8_19]|nr:MAG: hypothetical protein AMJ56_06895 [Anaerolineae bacterium SG8_19]
MTNEPFASILLFDSPARYQIRVLGWINESWSDRLEGMAISLDAADEEQPICKLEGELLDQAALIGVLITLYELHLPVLLVKCLTCQATNAREP